MCVILATLGMLHYGCAIPQDRANPNPREPLPMVRRISSTRFSLETPPGKFSIPVTWGVRNRFGKAEVSVSREDVERRRQGARPQHGLSGVIDQIVPAQWLIAYFTSHPDTSFDCVSLGLYYVAPTQIDVRVQIRANVERLAVAGSPKLAPDSCDSKVNCGAWERVASGRAILANRIDYGPVPHVEIWITEVRGQTLVTSFAYFGSEWNPFSGKQRPQDRGLEKKRATVRRLLESFVFPQARGGGCHDGA
jgi:hypothetical protein